MLLIDRVHRRWLIWALKKAKGNRRIAADILGISLRTVGNWKRRFNISKP